MPAVTKNLFICYLTCFFCQFTFIFKHKWGKKVQIEQVRNRNRKPKQNRICSKMRKKYRSPHGSSILSTGLQTYIQVQAFLQNF